MDSKIAVVVDSTTTKPEGFLPGLEFRTAPAMIIWDGEELRWGGYPAGRILPAAGDGRSNAFHFTGYAGGVQRDL